MYLKTMLIKHECYWVFGLKSCWGESWGEGCCVQEMPYERFQPFWKGGGGRGRGVVGVYKRFQMRI